MKEENHKNTSRNFTSGRLFLAVLGAHGCALCRAPMLGGLIAEASESRPCLPMGSELWPAINALAKGTAPVAAALFSGRGSGSHAAPSVPPGPRSSIFFGVEERERDRESAPDRHERLGPASLGSRSRIDPRQTSCEGSVTLMSVWCSPPQQESTGSPSGGLLKATLPA